MIPSVWTGEVFEPINPRFVRLANERYGKGEVLNLEHIEERSSASHRHYFACVNEAWKNLPEDKASEYPTAEHLRKRALIKAGFATMTDYVCSTKAEAVRWAQNLRREADEYAVVLVSDSVVRVLKAQSQSQKAMGKERFQESKEKTLLMISEMIGVSVDSLEDAANGAGA